MRDRLMKKAGGRDKEKWRALGGEGELLGRPGATWLAPSLPCSRLCNTRHTASSDLIQ